MYKICLVEDEKNLQELLKNYLEKENYEVFTFSSGEDAIDFIENRSKRGIGTAKNETQE